MDPVILYVILIGGALFICVAAALMAPTLTRACPNCTRDVKQTAKACRNCQYRFR